jgi:hypothetical protein
MIISGIDLAVFLFAVALVIGFFVVMRLIMAKAERSETSEDHDTPPPAGRGSKQSH